MGFAGAQGAAKLRKVGRGRNPSFTLDVAARCEKRVDDCLRGIVMAALTEDTSDL